MITESELISMGYRKLVENKNLWAKPVGFTIFAFDFTDQNVRNYFASVSNGESLIWSSKTISTLRDLKEYEHYVQYKGGCSSYEFHTS